MLLTLETKSAFTQAVPEFSKLAETESEKMASIVAGPDILKEVPVMVCPLEYVLKQQQEKIAQKSARWVDLLISFGSV